MKLGWLGKWRTVAILTAFLAGLIGPASTQADPLLEQGTEPALRQRKEGQQDEGVTGLQKPSIKNPAALEIFDAALVKFEADRVALRPWQYHQTLTTHQIDSTGKITARGTWHSIVRPGDPRPLEYTGKSVEGRISFFEAGAEEKSTAAASGKSEAPTPAKKPAAAGTKDNQAEWAVEAVHKYNLRNRYAWKRLPDAVAAGEKAYVLSFAPKPNQNASTREERFFGRLAGKIWVSKEDYTILRAEGALQSPASLYWIIARVTTFNFTYKLEPAPGPNRLLRLSRANATTVVAFPFYKVRQKHWLSVDKYEPRTTRGSHAGAPARPDSLKR